MVITIGAALSENEGIEEIYNHSFIVVHKDKLNHLNRYKLLIDDLAHYIVSCIEDVTGKPLDFY